MVEVSSENCSNFLLHNLLVWKQIQTSLIYLDTILIPNINPLLLLTMAITLEKQYLISNQANGHLLLTVPRAILANECLVETLPYSTLAVSLYKCPEPLL